MPGHIKLGKSNEPDPDPAPFLIVSMEMKREDMLKPYDSKKSVWVPDGQGGFREGLLDSVDGGKSNVMCGHEKKVFKNEDVGQVNPPKFEKCEDMANLTYLNDASVFNNLKTRFQAKLIYTYSGLFCVVVNPYKRYPIYTPRVVKMYLGKRRNEVPPHLWAITETAYRNMLQNSKNQSMLITGESGAGKTENTKKVISYLAMVASSGKKAAKKVSLEDQIVATNPILESYGNAKTSRNDNSSRFGKFIRIHFTTSGKLAGCDIESYLLEKSRITQQQAVERSYHIFYQLLQPFVPNMREKCCLGEDIYDYSYVSQGKVKVESIDDNEELEYTFSAFDIIGFSERETWECFMLTAAVMSMGEMKFKQKGRDDQAEPDDLTFANKVADLMGVNSDEMMKAFCKPKIKVGTEWVTKGQTCDQANNGVGGIARSIYDRIFKWLIIKCNDTLIDTTMKKSNFVAVLDIAGFEIFEYNGFEQISINFVNEKLQQFFNHHMFVVEQEEYISEGIDWAMVDFGMDLAAAIIMFEKPMGIWAILEEESLFPKATDRSFEEKLKAQHLGKSAPFAKPQSKTDKNAHFAIIHYAGIVSYNVTGWLEKNKDPVNDTVVDVLKRSPVNELLVVLWKDHPGQSSPPEEKGKKKKKGGGGKTVSSVYLVQLTDLMNTLHSTEPHFIRCIVPNTHKKPLEVEPPLIMHQLTCNGVLEGIRICMRGFPNRMLYPDFKSRYQILGAAEISSSGDNKTGVFALMDKVKFDREKYRLGHTKVFFRAGALAQLEEARDEIVLKLVRFMQGQFYGFLKRVEYKKKADQRELLKVIQRNFRKYQTLRNWGWFIIIQKTRPLIGQVNIEEELRLLEEKAKEAYGAYEEQLKTKEKLEQESIKIAEEKKKLFAQIESEQGNLSQYTERQAKASAQRADLEVQLQEAGDRLTLMERERHDATGNKKSLEQENVVIKKDIEDLELCIHRLEQEKTNRDHAIRSLNDDITHQDEIINRMNKEKKHMDEYSSKSSEELQTAEDKVEHLNKIKSKLEQTLDELEDSFEREKRGRAEIEKMRRKLEGELKVSQESVADLERSKREAENTIGRREKEISALNNKLEEDQCGVGKHQKHIKETQCRVEEMEEELEAERQARAKAERQRGDMARELEELSERLIEAGGATSAQIELNKKRESEVSKMRKDLEEIHIQQEATMQNLKRKHQDAVSEMSEQIDQLNKMKSKIDKDKYHIHSEIGDVRAAGDEISRSKAAAEKSNKSLLAQLNELNKKVEDSKLTVGDYENSKRRIGAENSDLLRQLQELENNASMLAKYKIQMASQLEEAKRVADDECKDRQLLFSKYRNLEHELDGTRYQLEEEASSKAELQRQFTKASHEADMWKSKFEKEGLAKAEELEMSKMKLQARLTESQGTIEQLNGKLGQLEKSKSTLQSEFEDMSAQADQAHILNSSMEKKARQFEKIVGEWKVKADSFSRELDNSQKECRNASSELFRVKNAYEEAIIQLDEVRRENKQLSNEIKDIMDQISEGGRSIHEIDKIRKRLESEKTELQAALEEAEGALEQEENKVLRSQLELNQVRQEIERRICEKEEEFQCTRKNFGKAIDQMQTALENETKSKAEALRMKKKLEADVSELETSLEHANAANMETQKTIKKYHQQIRESQLRLEDEQQAKEMARDEFLAADRKAHAHQNALEEARTLLEQADRVRRMTEQDLSDTNEQLSELTCQNQAIAGAQRKLGAEIQTLNAELDEMSAEARMSDDKAQKAMIDAAKLADELRREQEIAQLHERDCKVLECQAKDLQARVDETEANMLKSGRKAMNKMETRIRELESELDSEQRRLADSYKNLRKSERHIKELTYATDEDRKNHERMQGLIDQLQSKIRSYKKQIEEAEEIAAINLAKFRQTQSNLAESEERADLNEAAFAKYKARERASSMAPL
ncbi:myosin-4 [Lepeophtheirus salmonis]|uniref:myosin-4 n=1 Tax=Lepeophtheirus salmonis TaxID=72036 RepID=UPI001AE9CE16|nr:myosin heavy chain, muscle-like [Lepeophtheirus salmonis]XP_040566504.1 myosin heavy chain, muscle-like [Lepeophtheirus salmonis]